MNGTASKKSAKKEAAKQEKLLRQQKVAAAAAATASSNLSVADDPLAVNYGVFQSKTPVNVNVNVNSLENKPVQIRWWAQYIWQKMSKYIRSVCQKMAFLVIRQNYFTVQRTQVEALNNSLANKPVQIRGWAQTIRRCKNMTFLVIRQNQFTVQCVVQAQPDLVSRKMVKFAAALTVESVVHVEGVVSIPPLPIEGATQQVEIQVRKLYCVSRASPILPINIHDASRSEAEIEKAAQAGKQLARVNQDTRLNNRTLDLRTPANQGIFRIQSQVGNAFRQFLLAESFVEIHTPKLIAGSSEGGADVFRLKYHGEPACLAQSPQLHKQMSICAGFGRVFEIGPVFRAENSFTHRHLCEFTGLDVEMEIWNDYFEVMDVVDKLFVAMFDSLNTNCKKDLEAVANQHSLKPLKYLRNTLRLTYEEGIQMLKEVGVEVKPFGDLNTEAERKLGQLVLEKYDTEFYILHRYPLAARPFYTMPCLDNPSYSNSFDVFLRGEEIISGSQRINEFELLEKRAQACGIEVETISTYLDAFRNGVPLHGGFGVGLERVAMLFLGLDNIRKTSLYPRDPHRIIP